MVAGLGDQARARKFLHETAFVDDADAVASWAASARRWEKRKTVTPWLSAGDRSSRRRFDDPGGSSPFCGFVEDPDRRVGEQGLGQADALPVAEGKLAAAALKDRVRG